MHIWKVDPRESAEFYWTCVMFFEMLFCQKYVTGCSVIVKCLLTLTCMERFVTRG